MICITKLPFNGLLELKTFRKPVKDILCPEIGGPAYENISLGDLQTTAYNNTNNSIFQGPAKMSDFYGYPYTYFYFNNDSSVTLWYKAKNNINIFGTAAGTDFKIIDTTPTFLTSPISNIEWSTINNDTSILFDHITDNTVWVKAPLEGQTLDGNTTYDTLDVWFKPKPAGSITNYPSTISEQGQVIDISINCNLNYVITSSDANIISGFHYYVGPAGDHNIEMTTVTNHVSSTRDVSVYLYVEGELVDGINITQNPGEPSTPDGPTYTPPPNGGGGGGGATGCDGTECCQGGYCSDDDSCNQSISGQTCIENPYAL